MSEQNEAQSPSIPLPELIHQFCTHLKLAAGASTSAANTAESYANALKIFERFIRHAYSRKVGVAAPYPASMLDSDVLLAYYDWLNRTKPTRQSGKKGEAPGVLSEVAEDDNPPLKAPAPRYAHATIQHYLAGVKRFLAWAVSQSLLPQFDLAKAEVVLKGARGRGGKVYSHRKIDPNLAAILLYYDAAVLPPDPPADDASISNLTRYHIRRRQIALLRNRAMVYVLFDTGLRVSELTNLSRNEVDRALKETPLPEDVAIEVDGKGGRLRTVWITNEALIRIKAYLAARDDPADVLFVGGKKGQPITRQMVWKVVSDGAKGAGVGDFTGPHAFRHWLARQLFNDEEDPVPMEDVQALLGHASPTTTRTIYAPHSSKSRLRRAIQKARKRPEDTLTQNNPPDGDDY